MILRSAALGGVVLSLENNSICHMLYLMSADCPSNLSQPHKIIGLNNRKANSVRKLCHLFADATGRRVRPFDREKIQVEKSKFNYMYAKLSKEKNNNIG